MLAVLISLLPLLPNIFSQSTDLGYARLLLFNTGTSFNKFIDTFT